MTFCHCFLYLKGKAHNYCLLCKKIVLYILTSVEAILFYALVGGNAVLLAVAEA
jgi:hypothetical protein